jgi:uncharacterized glyoxalase superfamily protein PhnB
MIMIMNRSMPSAIIIPELPYPGVRQAVDWLCRSFGFTERLRIGNHRAQLSFGEGSIVVTERRAVPGASSVNECSYTVMVRLADVNGHYEHARQSGARIISPPTDYPYGERQYTVEDVGGHRWTFSQTIVDVAPVTWGGVLFE